MRTAQQLLRRGQFDGLSRRPVQTRVRQSVDSDSARPRSLSTTATSAFAEGVEAAGWLTDLDAYHLKRSAAYPVHYVYVFHSMVSSHMVFRPKAYDAYDTILCVGPHHTREIRTNEALHGLRPKRLIEHGYGRLDAIVEASRTRPAFRPSSGPAKSVLIAPSWGADSITATCADELITVLLSAGHGVTFRPHPMSVRQQKPVIDRIRSKFGSHPRSSLELDVRSSQSLHDADVMISDWSGAALEFALGLERPVLFIDTPRKVNNRDYARLQCEPLEVLIRPQVGVVVSPQQSHLSPQWSW